MDDVNIISAYLHNRNNCQTATVYQYNQGMILRIIGPTLPTAYEVDFANSTTGQSITQIGNENGVPIPDQFFTPGSMIHAWVVLVGEDYVVTRYHIMIPISPRAVRTSEEPTPSQKGAIDQAIAALNDAVDAAETAITHYPKVEDGYWYIWDVTAGEYVSTGVAAQGPQGDDGISPEITVVTITGGHRITIIDADGTKTVDVMDGTDGDDGRGIVSIEKTGTAGLVDTYTITYTSGDPTTFTVTNGADGSPGASAYVWIRYAATEPTQDSDMKTTPGAWMGIYSGDSATAPTAYTAYTWYNIKGQTGPVSDVQVNGTSVVSGGVADVPIASNSVFGVTKGNQNQGIGVDSVSKNLYIAQAGESAIKTGTNSYRPITPNNQHQAAFYGLAKAAGDTTQSASSNAVGSYTDAAKSAISTMLNGPVSVTGSTPAITALPGIQYICGECATLDITLPASGCIDVVFESGSTPTVLTITPPTGVTLKWANGFDPTALEADTTYEINIADGLGVAGSWT